jgi:hypothetical protein
MKFSEVKQGRAWHVMEVILTELLDSTGARLHDPTTGFGLLNP